MDRDDTGLVVIDLQEKFLPVIPNIKEVISNAEKVIRTFKILKMPIMITEQYPKGLGKTVESISKLIETEPIEKISFSCFGEEKFLESIEKLNIKNLVLLGIESHVCVLNTAIDAIKRGYVPYVVVDATSSRKKIDYETSVKRMMQEKIYLTTTEILFFQLLKKAGTPEFKEISKIIK
ncbi:MAG: hydrolase [Methanophagales archaeon]|nr:hydrolase [Methanophagales archaeon]